MSSVGELLDEAYRLSVVEEKHREAIDVCRRALAIEPENYRLLVYLGMLLSDHGNTTEIAEARNCFLTAIQTAPSADYFCTRWPEEAAIHHLGTWESLHGSRTYAAVFFLIDSFLSNNPESQRSFKTLIVEEGIPVFGEWHMIMQRIFETYQVKPK